MSVKSVSDQSYSINLELASSPVLASSRQLLNKSARHLSRKDSVVLRNAAELQTVEDSLGQLTQDLDQSASSDIRADVRSMINAYNQTVNTLNRTLDNSSRQSTVRHVQSVKKELEESLFDSVDERGAEIQSAEQVGIKKASVAADAEMLEISVDSDGLAAINETRLQTVAHGQSAPLEEFVFGEQGLNQRIRGTAADEQQDIADQRRDYLSYSLSDTSSSISRVEHAQTRLAAYQATHAYQNLYLT